MSSTTVVLYQKKKKKKKDSSAVQFIFQFQSAVWFKSLDLHE